MKFATLALIASASAIQISTEVEAETTIVASQASCVPRPISNNMFNIIDTNHNGTLSPRELYGAIEEWARATHHVINEANV